MKYIATRNVRPGIKIGDALELSAEEAKSDLWRTRVRIADGELVPANPEAKSGNGERKAIIAARLTELGIQFRGNLGETKLAELLPEGELETLFPAE